jgi:hypothetical protein
MSSQEMDSSVSIIELCLCLLTGTPLGELADHLRGEKGKQIPWTETILIK